MCEILIIDLLLFLRKLIKSCPNAIEILELENCDLVDLSDVKLRDLLELGLKSGSFTLRECRELVKSRGIPLSDDTIRTSVSRALELKESQRELAHTILRLARCSSLVSTYLFFSCLRTLCGPYFTQSNTSQTPVFRYANALWV